MPMYGVIRAIVAGMGMPALPTLLTHARRIGRAVGGSNLNRKRLKGAMDHIEIAFPDWDEEKRREYAIRAYEHLFMLGVEMAYTPRLLTHEGWAGRVDLSSIATTVRNVLGAKPVIFISGHCGNWEMSGYSLALLGFPIHALYRPLDLRPLDVWVRQVRSRRGLVLVDKFGAARQIPDIIARGAPLGFVADQNAGDRGIFVPFFNRMVSTYKAIGLTAMRYDATIVVGLAVRQGLKQIGEYQTEPEGLRYHIRAVDVFGSAEWNAQPDPLFYIASRYRRAIEDAIRSAPEQNIWMHRFWKSRPRWERQNKPMPGSVLEKVRQLPWMRDEDVERVKEFTRRDTMALHGAGAVVATDGDDEDAGDL